MLSPDAQGAWLARDPPCIPRRSLHGVVLDEKRRWAGSDGRNLAFPRNVGAGLWSREDDKIEGRQSVLGGAEIPRMKSCNLRRKFQERGNALDWVEQDSVFLIVVKLVGRCYSCSWGEEL
jgi:hypothetical protein